MYLHLGLCVMHTFVWFPLKSKGCFSVSKPLNEFKGEMGNVISLFSAGRFGTILCCFTQMTDCSGVGEKKRKLLLNFVNSEAG